MDYDDSIPQDFISGKVLWHEGLMLRAHHFQQQERYIEHLLSMHFSMLRAHDWGFETLDLNTSDLQGKRRISIRHATGRFMDGTLFDLGLRDIIPTPLEINPIESPDFVVLAIPQRDSAIAEVSSLASEVDEFESTNNTQPRHLQAARYSRVDVAIRDYMPLAMGGGTTEKVSVGRLAPTLRLASESKQGFETLPIARLIPGDPLSLDGSFVPPVTNIDYQLNSASPLVDDLNGVLTAIRFRAQELDSLLGDRPISGSIELLDLFRFSILNRHEVTLRQLRRSQCCHPESLFLAYSQLLADLLIFDGVSRTQRRAHLDTIYDHASPRNSVIKLSQEARVVLQRPIEAPAMQIPLAPHESMPNLFVSQPIANLDRTFFLVVQFTSDQKDEEKRSAMDHKKDFAQVKQIASAASIEHVVRKGGRGIPLGLPRTCPIELERYFESTSPNPPVFFPIDDSITSDTSVTELWREISESDQKRFGFGFGQYANLNIQLWGIRKIGVKKSG